MKIVYLCAKHPPYDGRIHYKISPSLISKGYTLINIHPNIRDSEDNGIELKGYAQSSGIWGRIKSIKNMYKCVVRQNPDVIIAPEPDSLVVAYIIKLKSKEIKVIFDCHEWYNVHFTHVAKIENKKVAKLLNNVISLIMKYISKRIDAVITVNDTMTEYFAKYNYSSFTIPSLMDQSYKPNMDLKRENFYYFGQFGNGGQEKILLDAARMLKEKFIDAKIIIVGGYREEDQDKLQEFNSIIASETLQDNIKLQGWLKKDEAFKLLNTGLAGIMRFDTQYYNGLPALPNKIFEYMSLGMAIICCKLNNELTKIVKTENCGVVINNETGSDLAEAIISLSENRNLCDEYGNNALKAVQEKYNWNNYGNLLNNIIQDMFK